MTESERYDSRRDAWIVALLVAIQVALALAVVGLGTAPMEPAARWLAIAALLAVIALITWMLLATYYVVSDERLDIHAGPFRWRIRLAELVAVAPTRMAWSAPALSLDRLRVEYGRGRWVLVSPRRQAEFLAALGVNPRTR